MVTLGAIRAGLGVLAVGWLAGCGGPEVHPVRGRIVYPDGTLAKELAGYTVTLESVDQAATQEKPGISGWGLVHSDGTFEIGTYRSGDGAVLGKHRVAISPPPSLADDPIPSPPIPLTYASCQTSGLEVHIVPGPNEITLTVPRGPSAKVPGGKEKK